jgi:mevalonate kinase
VQEWEHPLLCALRWHAGLHHRHLFHGQSSGLDIAGVAAISGVYFQQGLCTSVKQAWTPQWCLSSCGQTGATLSCINTVRSLWNLNPEHAKTIDQQMHASVQDALEALTKENPEQLVKAINTAADCFQQWGLISNELQQHMQILRDAGALAVKPTGSGGGGYVLSLWNNIPANIDIEFIQL